ncbi:MAG: AAA-associated domain-containing protein [Candidatus Anstonellales archaeon]
MGWHPLLPLPYVTVSEVEALLEQLSGWGGSIRLIELASELGMEIDELNEVIDMSEILKFVKVEKGVVTLTGTGKRIVESDDKERKALIKKRISALEPFRSVYNYIKKNPDISKAELLDFLKQKYAASDQRTLLKFLFNWMIYCDMLTYDIETDSFKIC